MGQASNIILLFFVKVAIAQILEDVNRDATETPIRREPNPDSALLAKLGNLFLDFDEAFTRYTAPKMDAEDAAKEQLYDKTQLSRSNYFGRIRENYRNLQKRVGTALGITGDLSILSDFLGINVQNRDGGQLVDVSLPFLPMKLSVNSNQAQDIADVGSSTPTSEDNIPVTSVPGQPKSDFESNLQVGNIQVNVGSKSSEEIPRVSVDIKKPNVQVRSSRQRVRKENRVQNTPSEYIKEGMRKLNQDLKTSSELDPIPIDTEEFSSRRGVEFVSTEASEIEDNSGVSGRILGDVLYSESTFDKIMKRVIKDSMWFLDSDLSPSKAFERLNKFTQKITQRNENSGEELSKERLSDQKKPSFTTEHEDKEHKLESTSETLQTRNKYPKPLHYEVDDKPNSDTIKLDIIPQSGSEIELQSHYEDNVLLAFTLEGVPLKLKMPIDVQDPLRFLHETLTAADVALNIPINSYDDLEPVGGEILQMGSGNRRVMARALFVDLSDSQQLKSLLKILRKFRSNS